MFNMLHEVDMSLTPSEDAREDFIVRPYQAEIFKIAIKQNTIIFLPTGSGKTYIAKLVINHFSHQIIKPNKKFTFFLVNTVPLVEQHALSLSRQTDLEIGSFSGDMNVDYWTKDQWTNQISKYQVIILTAQIFLDIVSHNYFNLEDANLLIFDECHQAVNDHSMRRIMQLFATVEKSKLPRVLGLTATLLNGNCNAYRVMAEVHSLETTFHSKVATVKELANVMGFSTNPKEKIVTFSPNTMCEASIKCFDILENMIQFISTVNFPALKTTESDERKRLDNCNKRMKKPFKKILLALKYHIEILGVYGGVKSTLASIIQMERLKKQCEDDFMLYYCYILITSLTAIKKILEDEMKGYNVTDQIFKFSSPQVLSLIELLRKYNDENLCSIIFVQQRFTSKALFYILRDLSQHSSDFRFIKCDFMFGFNAPSIERDSKEVFYAAKGNKKILNRFKNKEFNVLIASNVIEEGIDVPSCTLVVKFDKPTNYRSYIQSKGRARNEKSNYIIFVPNNELQQYMINYKLFQSIETILQNYLIGKNEDRTFPTDKKIQNDLYDDYDVPPFYVNGPNSAHVTGVSAISVLNRYCQMLYNDRYVQVTPNWFVEEHIEDNIEKYVVAIEMPIVCPLKDTIRGVAGSLKTAKRSAAVEVIKRLYEIGELTEKLLPRISEENEVDCEHFFKHWLKEKPLITESNAEIKPGTSKYIREYNKIIPSFLQYNAELVDDTLYYFHPIIMTPNTSVHMMNYAEIFNSQLQYGLLTRNQLPTISEFPIFLTPGEVNVKIGHSIATHLSPQDLQKIKKFNFFLYDKLLKILHSFLIFDQEAKDGFMLILPLNKENENYNINLDLADEYESLEAVDMPPIVDRINLQVNNETYLNKIVCPWYRKNESIYFVHEVCHDMNAKSAWPDDEYDTYESYYIDKYGLKIYSPNLPLIMAKGISQKKNCILPRSVTLHGKRSKKLQIEGYKEHFIPELCILQKYPGELWYQSYCLPTIVHRVICLLRAEDLRLKIVSETSVGLVSLEPNPLKIDLEILKQERKIEKDVVERVVDNNLSLPSTSANIDLKENINRDYAEKILEKQYPWRDDEEPVDIERDIENVTVMDLEYYDNFVSEKCSFDNVIKEKCMQPTKFPAITLQFDYTYKPIKMVQRKDYQNHVDQSIIFQCLTSQKANEIVNFERLETLGDSLLKFAVTFYLYLYYPKFTEGRLTYIKGKIIGNRNLLYCGLQKNLGSYMNAVEFSPEDNWLPPCIKVPDFFHDIIQSKNINISSLYSFGLTAAEQISGQITDETKNDIIEIADEIARDPPIAEENAPSLLLGKQKVRDKTISDCVEAILGAYLHSYGVQGGLLLIKWFNILPLTDEDISTSNIYTKEDPPYLIMTNAKADEVDFHIPNYRKLEDSLGYKFNNRAYLLEALTHASFSVNRVTDCYQRLEFLGDAVLDFLITMYIYEFSNKMKPGELTDLRSALVNNITFACLVVRHGFHKHLKFINSKLMDAIDLFVKFQEQRNHAINEDILILVEEYPMHLAEHVDVPKVLGDIFEALAGAVFMDSGRNLETTWRVFHKLMWKEIEAFQRDIPKNPVRMMYETTNAAPKFGRPTVIENVATVISCSVMVNGRKLFVNGVGENKKQAKKVAAKLALKLLRS